MGLRSRECLHASTLSNKTATDPNVASTQINALTWRTAKVIRMSVYKLNLSNVLGQSSQCYLFNCVVCDDICLSICKIRTKSPVYLSKHR